MSASNIFWLSPDDERLSDPINRPAGTLRNYNFSNIRKSTRPAAASKIALDGHAGRRRSL